MKLTDQKALAPSYPGFFPGVMAESEGDEAAQKLEKTALESIADVGGAGLSQPNSRTVNAHQNAERKLAKSERAQMDTKLTNAEIDEQVHNANKQGKLKAARQAKAFGVLAQAAFRLSGNQIQNPDESFSSNGKSTAEDLASDKMKEVALEKLAELFEKIKFPKAASWMKDFGSLSLSGIMEILDSGTLNPESHENSGLLDHSQLRLGMKKICSELSLQLNRNV